MSEKNKDFEKKAMEFVKKYPLTEEEAFKNAIPLRAIPDQAIEVQGAPLTPKKFKKIDL
jgi:hypothetical protein